jgi:hypothetical protein
MKQAKHFQNDAAGTIPYASFPFEERETFQWLCRRKVKDPADFEVEGYEHSPNPGSSLVHRDVVVRYIPTGKARGYCPDYGESWIVKFSDDLEVHYFTPQDGTPLEGLELCT